MQHRAIASAALLCLLAGASASAAGNDAPRPFEGRIEQVRPKAVRAVRLLDGLRIQPLSDWMPIGDVSSRGGTQYVFDAFQNNPCTPAPPTTCPAGLMWRGSNVSNPAWVNDMTPQPISAAGEVAVALEWSMHIASNEPAGLQVYFFFADQDGQCSHTNIKDGVSFDFGTAQFNPAFGYSTFGNLSLLPSGGINLPSTATGAYIGIIGSGELPGGTISLHPHAQPMLWGVGNDETPPDGRVGLQGPFQLDTDDPAEPFAVCRDYTVADPDPGVPAVLGAAFSVAYVSSGEPACFADCDASGDLSTSDFTCFRNAYLANDLAKADCDASGDLSTADFTCFRTAYLAGCP